MKFKPILFSTPMVQAILEGRKTQTRRIIKPQPNLKENSGFNYKGYAYGIGANKRETQKNFIECVSKIQKGDILWVRETWSLYGWSSMEGFVNIKYKDGKIEHFEPEVEDMDEWLEKKIDKLLNKGLLKQNPDDDENLIFTSDKTLWEPSIFMPKWASRIFLECTNVRVERLQDIKGRDAIQEGVKIDKRLSNLPTKVAFAISSFRSLWESINGKESWTSNPFVWVYDFKQVERPKNFLE